MLYMFLYKWRLTHSMLRFSFPSSLFLYIFFYFLFKKLDDDVIFILVSKFPLNVIGWTILLNDFHDLYSYITVDCYILNNWEYTFFCSVVNNWIFCFLFWMSAAALKKANIYNTGSINRHLFPGKINSHSLLPRVLWSLNQEIHSYRRRGGDKQL